MHFINIHHRVLMSSDQFEVLNQLKARELKAGRTLLSSVYSRMVLDLSELDQWIQERCGKDTPLPFPGDVRTGDNEYFHQVQGILGAHYGYTYYLHKEKRYIIAKIKDLRVP